jgi:DNA-binding transcriptional LysR family regulator
MSDRLPPLRLLQVFAAVQRAGGPRAAAAELNVSQPAVSQALRQLEDFLGAKLFDRRTRPARLTEAGRLLHTATAEGLGRIAAAVGEIARLERETARSLRVACTIGFATYWLMPRLAAFNAEHPEVAVHVSTIQAGAPALDPGVDIAARFGDGRWDDGAVTRLFAEEIRPLANPALARRLAGEAAPLAAAPLIHVEADDPRWTAWPAYLRATGQSRAPVVVGGQVQDLRFTNYVQATQAALAGQGIMLGWRSITGDLVAEGRLAPVGAPPLTPDSAYYLVTAPAARAPAALLVAWLKEHA